MGYLGSGGTLGSGSSADTAQYFTDVLDSNGERIITGLSNAHLGTVEITIESNGTEEAGDIRPIARTATTITLQSTAGYKHAGVAFTGKLSGSITPA